MSVFDPRQQPASAHLLADLRQAQQRHRVQVFLDKDAHYTAFADALVAAGPDKDWGPTFAWRGSHLAMLRDTAPLTGGLEPPRLVLHLPGFVEDTVAASPLYHLYALNEAHRYRKALPTLVREAAAGRVDPARVDEFLSQQGDGLSLATADAWLANQLGGARDALQGLLDALSLPQLVHDLLEGGPVTQHLPAGAPAVLARLTAHTGLSDAWVQALLGPARKPTDLAYAANTWALGTEYVFDLRRPPVSDFLQPLTGLSAPLRQAGQDLAAHLRQHHPAVYRQTALDLERLLTAEQQQMQAEDLGQIDTFRFEEQALLDAAVAGHPQAAAWAQPRARGGSFWTAEDPHRRDAWRLVQAVAALDAALAAAPAPDRWPDLDAALDAYAQALAPVDRAHRHLEQQRTRLLHAQVPDFAAVRAMLDAARARWAAWAARVQAAWAAAALAHPLPGDARQQRHVFDRAVRPGIKPDAPTAYLLVDALRYEMAAELMDSLAGTPQIRSSLRPWASELPSETAVGMNALAPVARGGRLFPHARDGAIKGFKAGEFTVSTPKDRVRAMREALQLPALPHLDLRVVAESTPTDLMTRCGTAPLLVVMGDEIDKALENRLGPEHFDTALRRLRTAVLRLREAGFKRVVITADHGFLLRRGLDQAADGPGKIAFGAKATPQRRHVWWPHPQQVPHTVSVPASALRYEGMPAKAQHLLLASGLAVFDRGHKQDDCVHGGETPQERVIPVLTLDFQGQAVRGDDARFAVHIQRGDPVAGMQCLTLRVTPAEQQGALSFALPATLDLLLHAELDGARLEVVDVRGGERHGDVVRVALDTPCEVFAKLTADYDGRSRVVAHRPERPGSLVGARSDAFFAVVGQVRVKDQTQAPDPGASIEQAGTDWREAIAHAGHRRVLEALASAATLGEDQIIQMLGGSRQARRFARMLDGYLPGLPFGVRVESHGGIKRYVREMGS